MVVRECLVALIGNFAANYRMGCNDEPQCLNCIHRRSHFNFIKLLCFVLFHSRWWFFFCCCSKLFEYLMHKPGFGAGHRIYATLGCMKLYRRFNTQRDDGRGFDLCFASGSHEQHERIRDGCNNRIGDDEFSDALIGLTLAHLLFVRFEKNAHSKRGSGLIDAYRQLCSHTQTASKVRTLLKK